MLNSLLTAEDILKLKGEQSDDARVEASVKVCQVYASEVLTDQERKIAEDIFRVLVSDHSRIIRESVSNNLKESKWVPHDLALKLAKDIEDSVAFPILHYSEVLNDQDLIEIIRTTIPVRQNVIADRKAVSTGVSEALVKHGDETVVTTLVSNCGAEISAKTFETAYTLYNGNDAFNDALLARDQVPASVRSKIIAALTGQVLDKLSKDSLISPSILADIVIQTHDKLVMQLSDKSTEVSVIELVENLKENGYLTQSIIIRALCQGDLLFFEVAMAALAGVPVRNAEKLINDSGGSGFRALYAQAGLDKEYLVFFLAVHRICKELLASGEDYEQSEFRRKLIERFLTEETEFVDKLDKNDLDYLIGKI